MSFKELGYSEADKDVLGSIFAARVSLAKRSEDQAAADARTEHQRTLVWMASRSDKERSFLWFCDIFDLDPDAVRKAVEQGRQ